MTLYNEISKHKAIKNYKGEFGVEIETEGLSSYVMPKMALWVGHTDDSLRGPAPYEYVLRNPLNFKDEIPQALTEFKDKLGGIKFDDKSFTTSVHTHVNMLNEKFTTMGNFLTIYCIVENLLKKFAGPSRESNLFCLPLCDAEENFHNIIYILDCIKKKKWGHMELDANANKYAALNLTALWKYGSLEIRLLRGTTDVNIIHDWIGMQHSMLEFARQDITPREIIWSWKNKGTELLTDIFGPYRKLLRFQNEDDLIERNFWYAANTALAIDDWRALDNAPQPKKLQSKNLDELSMKIYGKPFDSLDEMSKGVIIKNFRFIEENMVDDFALQQKAGNFDPFLQPKAKMKKVGWNPPPLAPGDVLVIQDPGQAGNAWADAAADQPNVHFPDEDFGNIDNN